MFSSENQKSPPTSAGSGNNSTGQKQATRSGTIPSIISNDVMLKCVLISSGDVLINGCVEGKVGCVNLVIGETGQVDGEIRAETVTIRGTVKGDIRARKVFLHAPCHVDGNILHEVLAVEAGALFEGKCLHFDNPLADDEILPEATSTETARHSPRVNCSQHYLTQANATVTDLAKLPPIMETETAL